MHTYVSKVLVKKCIKPLLNTEKSRSEKKYEVEFNFWINQNNLDQFKNEILALLINQFFVENSIHIFYWNKILEDVVLFRINIKNILDCLELLTAHLVKNAPSLERIEAQAQNKPYILIFNDHWCSKNIYLSFCLYHFMVIFPQIFYCYNFSAIFDIHRTPC